MTRWGLGVDLGTSFSAGAVSADGRVELLEVGGDRRVPSTVLRTQDGRLLAGSYAERMVGRLPDRAERNPKRYVGRAPMLLGGQPVSAVDALAAVLALFVAEGRRRHDDTDPARLVLTHPAAWSAAQRAELREVAARVLPRVGTELVDEPVAAALHYARTQPVEGEVAVYDLGAGTVDTAVLAAGRGGFRLVGRPGGDPDVGGEVFDQLVYRHFGEQLAHSAPQWWSELGTDPQRLAEAADLLTEARIAKESLSEVETASQYVLGADADVHISRAELDALIDADVRRSARVLAETLAGAEPRAVFLTGGASRTPLVQQLLRDAHGAAVRTQADPKSAVALGAAWRSLRDATPARPRPPVAHRVSATPGALVTLADGVLDARVAAGRLYAWSSPDGPGGGHRITLLDPRTGHADRKIRFGRLVGWAVTDAGIIVAERRDGDLRCHTLAHDLSVGTSAVLPTPYRPFLLAEGPRAWAVLRSPDTRMVDGPAIGEVGSLAVQVFPLGTGGAPGPVLPLGPATYWYTDGDRRLLDPAAPTSSAPGSFGDGRSVTVVVGHPPAQHLPAQQALAMLGPTGEVTPVPTPVGGPWIQQVLGAGGRWLLATTAGLESYADLPHGRDRRPFLPRPPAGAVRWVAAGTQVYGLAVEGLVPARGVTLHALVDGQRRDLGRWPALLGTPAAARADDAPRVRVDGSHLLVGVGDGSAGSQVLRADPTGARVVASAPGWLEPVGRAGDTLLARHVPGVAPGDGCTEPGLLVRVL